jgi:hypothetical protein
VPRRIPTTPERTSLIIHTSPTAMAIEPERGALPAPPSARNPCNPRD